MLPVLMPRCSSPFSYNLILNLSLETNPCFDFLLNDVAINTLEQYTSHITDSRESYEVLRSWMKGQEHKHTPPVELIYWLHKENLLLATTYFYIHKQYCEYFYEVFEEVYSNLYGNNQERISKAVSVVAAAILNMLKHSDEQLQLFAEEFGENLILKLVNIIESNTLKRSPLVDFRTYCDCNEDCLQYFSLLHLKYLLSVPCEYSVHKIVEIHTKKWTTNFFSPALHEHIEEMISRIPGENIIDEINKIISESNFSWKFIFIIISVLVKSSEGALVVKGAVDSWLKRSFDENHSSSFYMAVLIARHCCYEKARYFQSYANWFSSLNFKQSKSFTLFFKFLIEILPHEPPLYLKIHLNKVPSAPHGCQSLLVDYIVLAKTRLADLNESGEYIGLFSDYHETDEEGQQADVARVIAHYEETKEIAKPLLEAYVLRRQYYEKVFLKQLLKVPESNDTARANVIHKLYSMGKIPTTLFNIWTKL